MEEREDYDDSYYEDYDDDDYEIPYEIKEFYIGQEIRNVEYDGGVTVYGIARITKDRSKVLVTERWYNVDGTGKRKPHWCKVIHDNVNGDEKFQIDPSYDGWINA